MLRCPPTTHYSKLTRFNAEARIKEWKIKIKKFIIILTLFSILSLVYFGFLCLDYSCNVPASRSKLARWSSNTKDPNNIEDGEYDDVKIEFKATGMNFDDLLYEKFHFDINSHDVIVFLHIQKTGGTSFGRHLVQDLDLQRPCTCQRKQKRCYCLRPTRNENWLFSRYSTGWKCGLHADWTELTNCVNSELDKNEGEPVKRRYFYITLIREPVSRFLSEFKHVQRGATWKNSRHWCGGRPATKDELQKCYNTSSWKNVSLDDFLNCSHNLALNRQARMVSDLSLVGCYNRSYMAIEERDRIILASAKHNLKAMAFFALTEFQKIGQYTFEKVFNLRFAVPFSQFNSTRSSDYIAKLKPEQIDKIRELNKLDLELYEFAKKLMYRRFTRLRQRDANFEERWQHLGELHVQTEFNWDKEVEPNPVTRRILNSR